MTREKLLQSIHALDNWRAVNGWKGYDPFGIRKNIYERFGRGQKAFEIQRTIAGLEKEYYFNNPGLFHDLLKDRGYLDPKTFANFGMGYINLFKLTKEDKYKTIAIECGDWLINDANERNIAAWGHPFVWHTEVNNYFHKKNNPNIYITSLVVHFLLDLYELTGDKKYNDKACEGVEFLAASPYDVISDNEICFWYIIDCKELRIHNGNLFVASVLLRTEKKDFVVLAEKAVNYAVADQNRDGSWYYYGPPRADNMKFIDNYHSGFILDALYQCNKSLQRDDVNNAIKTGLSHYKKMFSDKGEPFRLDGAQFPQDIHDAAQGIITFTLLKDFENENIEIAAKIADWAISEMQDNDGHFYYRKLADNKIIKFPYMRWSQAPMFKALTALAQGTIATSKK